MSMDDGPRAEGGRPGLRQLGVRLVVGALLVGVVLLLAQRRGEDERQQRAAFPLVSGTIRIADLAAPIEILRDARGVPHVLAPADGGGFFGLGFAHAQDRLSQMLWLRRRAAGRSAEVVGREGLAADRLARLLSMERASRAAVEALPEATRTRLEAYAAGVNARLARLQRGVAAPPRTLREPLGEIEPWRPADSLAVVKLLSWCMGGTLETTLVLDELIQRLDSVPARPFFPGSASVDFGISPGFDVGEHIAKREAPSTGVSELEATRSLCGGIGIPTGSAWVIGGRSSESGAPLLVADWHLEPSVPALFYEARLVAGGLEVAGATLPGSPIFWAGRNRDLAWAAVPASASVSDLFIETLREHRGEYQNGRLWVPVEERAEILRWRDALGVLREGSWTIHSTRHGPLIDSLHAPLQIVGEEASALADDERVEGSGLALAWTGAREGDGTSSMLALLRASSAAELEAALESHHEPVLAFVHADREGGGGVQIAGWLPKRALPTGLVPVQGRLRSFDWRERVALTELPRASLESGPRRWLFALDQPWPSRGGLDQLEWLWRSGEAASRLEARLSEMRSEGRIDLRAAAGLLQDDVAQRAQKVVAAILGLAGRTGPLPIEAEEIARILRRWDGRMNAESSGAAAYQLVLEALLEDLLREPFGDALFERYLRAPHVRPRHAIERLVLRAAALRRPGGWTDERRVSEAARRSLRGAWVALGHRLGPTRSRWQWGALHRVRFASLVPGLPLSGALDRTMRAPGSDQTLLYAGHRAGVSFDVGAASTYRIALDLASSDGFLSTLAPGQSEHPGHRHFADGLPRWLSSRMSIFATSRLVIEEESTERLVLEPAP
ncbi:MAG: penicillin acylase family protein [Deltaproteobacteria bacterium]|jgi:penicillin amidase|nr:penicillin acylase family protein [Deltaproteobacteria bacterium]